MKKYIVFTCALVAIAGSMSMTYSQVYQCKPPTKYVFSVSPSAMTSLLCRTGSGYNTNLGDFALTDATNYNELPVDKNTSGYALARLRLTYKNFDTEKPPAAYFTDGVYTVATYMAVGNGSQYSTNQILCPTEIASAEQQVSYGYISAAYPHISIKSHITRSDNCESGKVKTFANGVLEVWVEDPHPSCQKKSVVFESTYNRVGFLKNWSDPDGVGVGAVWQRSAFPFSLYLNKFEINRITLPERSTQGNVIVMANTEGSPRNSPQLRCDYAHFNNNIDSNGNGTAPTVTTEGERPRAGAEMFSIPVQGGSPVSINRRDKWLPTADHMGHFNLGLYANLGISGEAKTFVMKVFTNVDPVSPEAQASNPLFKGADAGLVDIFTGAGKGYANIGVVRE